MKKRRTPSVSHSGMVRSTIFLSIAALGLPVSSTLVSDAQIVFSEARLTFSETCQEISDSISAASMVYYDGLLYSAVQFCVHAQV